MACLEKIDIQGIRSFGPEKEDKQRITFQKPLTLILGENGCGKSTIIECLKYVTTHKEPSGKGTFVHDPSLTNKSTVKGLVKLRLYDINGSEVHVCKNLQTTRTKKNLSTKILDNVISRRDKKTNKMQSISNKCADFSYEMTRIFGVSKAVLENVIFCTQEDSHWPLETDQKLKEKFDQLFDSDKYNKCINKVRDKKRGVRNDLKLLEKDLMYLKENKAAAADRRRKLQKTKDSQTQYRQQIQQYEDDLKPIENKLREVANAEMDLAKNLTLKETKKSELKMIEENKNESKIRIRVEFKGTDEALKAQINSFAEDLDRRTGEIERINEEVVMYGKQEEKLQNKILSEQKLWGELNKEEELIKKDITERNRLLQKLASELELNGYSMSSEDDVRALFNQVKQKIKEKLESFSELQKKVDKEDQDFQNKIDKLKEDSMSAQNDVNNKEKSIKNSQQEIKNLQEELKELDQSASKLAKLEAKLTRASKNLENLQSSFNVDNAKKELKDLVNERNNLENRSAVLDDEISILQKQAAVTAELEVQMAAKNSKDRDFKRLMHKHEETITNLLGSVPQSGFKMAIQNHVDTLRRRVKELTATQTRKERELTELETNRKHQKEQLEKKEEMLRKNQDEIYNECEGGDFDNTLKTTENILSELRDKKGILSSSQFLYNKYIQQLQKENPCCPLCSREFDQENDVQDLIDELTQKIRKVPDEMTDNDTKLQEKELKINKLMMLKPKYDRLSVLKNEEIPALRLDLERIENKIKKVRKELEDLANQISVPQKDETTCSTIQGDMALLDQYQSEQKKLEKEIEKLDAQLGGSKTSKGTLQDKLNEQDNLRKNLKTAREKIDKLQTKLNQHNEELNTLQATKNSLMEEMSKIHGGVGQRNQLEGRLEGLIASEEYEREELKELRSALEAAKKSLDDAVIQKRTAKSKNAEKINNLRNQVNNLQRQCDDIESLQRRVKASEDKNIPKKLEAVKKAIENLERDIQETKKKKIEASTKIEDIKRDSENQEAKKADLMENLKYREQCKKAEKFKKEIAELEEKFGNLSYDLIVKEKRKLKNEEENINQKKAEIQGRLVELANQIGNLEEELRSDTYRTADEKYNKVFVQAELLKAVDIDLERYATAMEWATMTYHRKQMERVNAFAREYWRKIYQGNDIDYIEIKTDDIEQTEKRRNYNYRLVQVKNDVQLDMRNRCSAGQKMLASLIIRMALAETFSSNCGILTLDEPTTNLDRKNIRNLARTLNEVLIAKQSAGHNNFQLIVITHDEEFVRELQEVDAINEYVRIKRSPSGKSQVKVEIIGDESPVSNQGNRNDNANHFDVNYD